MLQFGCSRVERTATQEKVSRGPDDRVLTDPRSVVSLSNPAARPLPVSDLYSSHAVSGASWSPNGSEIVFTADLSGRSNIWKIDTSGGLPKEVARSGESQTNPVFSPDGKWIVFEQDHAGDEIHDLWGIPAEGGEAVNLTRTPDVDEWGAHWSNDGAKVVD
jgi:Tol biopolymer transport system component